MSFGTAKTNIDKMNGKLSLFTWKIIYDWSFSLAALIAYYLLISLLPLILSMFAVVSLIFGNDPKFQNRIRDRLVKAFPEQGLADIIDALLHSLSTQAGLIFVISFIISLFTGSRLFVGLDDVLTIIYRIRERTILNQNILAIKMIIAFVIIMPFIVVFSSVPAILEKHESFYQFLTTVSSGVFTFVFFLLIYTILPNRSMSCKQTWCGSLIAAVGLQCLLLIFPLYVHEFMADYVGQLGFIIITLLLFYLFGLLFVICAQINAFFFDHVLPLRTGLGTCLSEMAIRENIELVDDETFPSNNTIIPEFGTQEHEQRN